MTLRGLALAAAAALAAFPAAAAAQAPPENDHYLSATQINSFGEPLERNATLVGSGDTTAATEQPDMFAPDGPGGGPPEPTQCESSPYGKTVWYDFHPDRSSIAKIVVNSQFDAVIGILGYNRTNAQPRFPGVCIDRLDFTNEEMVVPVIRGRSYSVQVGGFQGAGGQYQVLFDFTRPPAVVASPTLRATPTSSGIRVSSLKVDAPRGARVSVSCTRRACRSLSRAASADFVGHQRLGRLEPGRPQAQPTASWSKNGDGGSSVEPQANASRTLTFTNVRGKSIRSGAQIRIRVTQPNHTGRYIEYRVVRGNFSRRNLCIEMGSTRARSCRGL